MKDLTLGLSGKVAIVTGAAGGIGRSTVDLLTAHGVQVVAEDLNPAVNDLAYAGRVVTLVGDCAAETTAVRAVQLAQKSFGRLDVLLSRILVSNEANSLLDHGRLGHRQEEPNAQQHR